MGTTYLISSALSVLEKLLKRFQKGTYLVHGKLHDHAVVTDGGRGGVRGHGGRGKQVRVGGGCDGHGRWLRKGGVPSFSLSDSGHSAIE